jgi:ribosomal peptide maturation radical SAM protein 1
MRQRCRTRPHVLLVVPPFGATTMPSLGLHTLQAFARRLNHNVSVLYGNVLFASRVGRSAYESVMLAERELQLGARIFAPHAFGFPLSECERVLKCVQSRRAGNAPGAVTWAKMDAATRHFLEEITRIVRQGNYDVVGCSTTFDQTQAALAILNVVKRKLPEVLTLLGGANCEGEMGEALAEITPTVDYIFSGESEHSLCTFLNGLELGNVPSSKIITGPSVIDLDDIPCPDFSEYFSQLNELLPDLDREEIWLSYESSRGCWWGQKHHCTFCGLNGSQMTFRFKSETKVEEDLTRLIGQYPSAKICMADNIMPWRYHNSLVPRLGQWARQPEIFYEQKSNLTLRHLAQMAQGGIRTIQPGIETLSTRLLCSIKKGTTAAQNILTLKNASVCGISVIWNFLCGIPGETEDDYREMIDFIPWITHLQPPRSVSAVSIDRFSPYFMRPRDFGIQNVRPLRAYRDIFPSTADLRRLAYHFEGDYESCLDLRSDVMERFHRILNDWRAAWGKGAYGCPRLAVASVGDDRFWLFDSRQREQKKIIPVTRLEAETVIWGTRGCESDVVSWALENHFALEMDGRLVPLAVADLETMNELGGWRNCREMAGEALPAG